MKACRMKIGILTVLASLVLAVQANVISVNFYTSGTGSAGKINTNSFVGVVSDLTWDDCMVTAGSLNFTNVNSSDMDVSINAPQVAAAAASWNNWANRSGFAATAATAATVDLSQIPYEKYYVIVYVSGYGSPYKGELSDGTTTKYFDFLGLPTIPSFVESTDTNSTDGYDPGSYVVFGSEASPLSGASLNLTLSQGGSGTITLGGVQVVQVVPEPTTIGLFGVAGVTALLIRRVVRK